MLLTATEAAAALRVGLTQVKTMRACGLLQATPIGKRWVYESETITKLAEARELDPHIRALVVRMGAPTPAGESARTWLGWREDWDRETKDLAISRWWPVSRADAVDLVGHPLIATVAGLIVDVRTIASVVPDEPQNDRRAFELADCDKGKPWIGMWLRLGPGSTAQPLPRSS